MASLAGTELDIPSIRVVGIPGGKLPMKKGWLDLEEDMSIEEMLTHPEEYNCGIRTGERLGKGKHLVVLDIDLKEKTFKHLADRLLDIFKRYYVVKTPNGGYHIYVKVESEERFKSASLSTLEGVRTTIEILGEKKKSVGPGSVIEGMVMYKRKTRLMWKNSLSKIFISREELVSKLSSAGLMIVLDYRENESIAPTIIDERDRSRLLGIIEGAKSRWEVFNGHSKKAN